MKPVITWIKAPSPKFVPVVADKKDRGTAKTKLIAIIRNGSHTGVSVGKILRKMTETKIVSWKSRVLGKGFSFIGVYTILPNRNGFSPK